MRQYETWWNLLGFAVVAAVVVLALLGLVLPRRVVVTMWCAILLLYVVAQATWSVGTIPPALEAPAPWTWTLEPAVITLWLLLVRPVVAVGLGLAVSLTPAISAFVLVGSVPDEIYWVTPSQMANIVYLVIFIGLRSQLRRMAVAENDLRREEERRARADANAEHHARLARLVHDEVLSVLTAGMHVDGAPPPVLRQHARRAAEILDESVVSDQESAPIPVTEAVRRILAGLRALDEDFGVETLVEGREWTRPDVVEAMSLAAAEALRNSLKHAGAGATRTVRVAIDEERLRVAVIDDGKGFSPSRVRSRLGIRQSIEGRMRDLGGTARIRSLPGRGTEVVLRWAM